MHSRLPSEVDAHAVEFDDAARGAVRAAHQRPAAGGQLGGLEGLAQEIVGAEIQRLDLVGQGAAGGEDQRGQGLARAAQAPHQAQAVGARQPDVDHRHGEFLVHQRGLGGLGAGDPVNGVIRGGQAARDGVGDDVIVFYD